MFEINSIEYNFENLDFIKKYLDHGKVYLINPFEKYSAVYVVCIFLELILLTSQVHGVLDHR